MKRIFLSYDSKLKERARYLRTHSTLGEVLLWGELKNGKMMGYDFHRQKPILRYIVDFYCPELRLIIEVDGSTHDDQKADYDERRQKELEALGLTVLRFTEAALREDVVLVGDQIREWIDKHR